MEHRITITVAEHGYEPDNGERMLEGFLATHPEVGPAVSQNTVDGTLTIAFTFDAPHDLHEALSRCEKIAGDGLRASGLPATKITAVHAVALEADELERAPELQPA